MIALSYCISWLGAYTSTQIVIHAKYTRHPYTKWLWTFLASVAFGFSAIWSMHFVGMLACGLDVKINFDKTLTAFSAFVAVLFTFAALSSAYVSESIENSRGVQALYNTGRQLRKMIFVWRRGPQAVDVEGGGYVPISTASDAGDDVQAEGNVGRHDEQDNDDGEYDPNERAPLPLRSRTPSFSRSPVSPPRASASGTSAQEGTVHISRHRPSPKPQRTSNEESLDSLSNTDDSNSETFRAAHSRNNSQESTSTSFSSSLTTSGSSNAWNEPLHAGLSRETRMRIKAQATDRPIPKFGWRYWIKQHYKAISVLIVLRAAIWALAVVFMHYSGKL